MKKISTFLIAFLPFIVNAQIITTIVGNGTSASTGDGGMATSASISGPNGLVIDASGNMYVSEYYSHVVRKITAAGVISTFAGTGIAGGLGDGGPATAAQLNAPVKLAMDAAGNLYIADQANHKIRKVTPSGVISTVAGTGSAGSTGDGGLATSAQLNGPRGLYINSAGEIYIADLGNHKIRKIDATGIISTVVGTGTPGGSGDGGAATAAELHSPFAVTFDGAGNMLVADPGNHKIRKITPSGIISTIAGTGTAGFSGDGGPATAAKLNNVAGLELDALGNIYIADQLNNRIRKINTDGTIMTIAGTGVAAYSGDGAEAIAAAIYGVNELLFDGAGNLLLTDNQNHRVRSIEACITSFSMQPVHDTESAGDTAYYTVATAMPFPSYLWQADTGTGFYNLTNVPPFSGVTTSTLRIANLSSSLDSTYYRCKVSNESGCTATSLQAILRVNATTGISPNIIEQVKIFPNPSTNDIYISLPGAPNDAHARLMNTLGQTVRTTVLGTNVTSIDISTLPSGVYTLILEWNGAVINRRIVKSH